MLKSFKAALVLGLFAAGAASAQTMGTTPSTSTPAVTAPSTPAVTAPSTTSATMGMRPATAPTATGTAPAAVSSAANPRTTAAPVAGANSFTRNEARSRIAAQGFSNVTALKKDNKGIWRATAMKDGKSTPVALDYQGNVVAQ